MPLTPEELKNSYRMRVLTRQVRFENQPWQRNWRKPGELKHGTTTGYRRGCRCDECRLASNRAITKYRNTPHTIPAHYHGNENTYTLHASRCEKCKTAHAEYCRYQRNRPRCQNKPCRKLLKNPEDGRRKYCSEACRIEGNEKHRREYDRIQKQKKRESADEAVIYTSQN